MNLSMMRGDTRELTVTLTDEDGYPIDLDDLSDIAFTARYNYDSDSVLIQKDLADGVVITDAASGTCTVTIDPVDTEGLARRYRLLWDIQVIADYDDAVRTVARGYLTVEMDVTL